MHQIRLFLLFVFLLAVSASAFARQKKTETPEVTCAMPMPDGIPAQSALDVMMADIVPMEEFCIVKGVLGGLREGIDVSHYQGVIDWQKVAREAKICYAYMKCTEGATIQDEYYRRNVQQARREGISVGAYHFYRPTSSPEEQFRNMTQTASRADMDLVPIIDIEHRGKDTQERFIRNLRQFLQSIEQHYGKRPMLYTGQNFYNRYLVGEFNDYPWMIAKYQEEMPILNDANDYAFWQFTSKAQVPGIKGNVDRSCIMEGHDLEEIVL